MAIHILYGPGGTGKSYWQIRRIVQELRHTPRNVGTNLSVEVPRLQQYCEEQFPGEKIDVVRRLFLLSEDDAKHFWDYRGPELPNEAGDLVRDAGTKGVLYVIDEAGAAGFDATGWASSDGRSVRGLRAAWYLDQQRKFGDDVIASQNGRRPAGIAKPFRDKAHYFIRLKNGYLASLGIFKGRGRFTADWFTHEPEAKSEAVQTEHWEMDASGLASCYKTEVGVGVVGSSADKGKRAKGIPILWAIPGAIVLAAAISIGLPMLLAKGMAKASGADKTAPAEPSAFASGPVTPVVSAITPGQPAGEPVRVVGYVKRGSRINVVLSDGRTLNETDKGLQSVDRNGATVDGVKIWMQRPAPRPASVPVSAPVVQTEPPAVVPAPWKGEHLHEFGQGADRLVLLPALASPQVNRAQTSSRLSRGTVDVR